MMFTQKRVVLLAISVLTVGVIAFAVDDDESSEKSIAFKELPAAVQAVAKERFGAKAQFEASIETDEDVTLYEVVTKENGLERTITLTKDGAIAEVETEIQSSELPIDLLKKIQAEFPGAKLNKAEAIQKFYYEVQLDRNGEKVEVAIAPSGEIEEVE